MTEPDRWRSELALRVADQVEYIISAFHDKGTEIDVVPAANRGVGYMCAKGQLLVRDEYLGRVREILREILRRRDEHGREQDQHHREADQPGTATRVIAGVVLLDIGETELYVPDVLDEIDWRLGAGIATPNHVLTVANSGGTVATGDGEVAGCPATEPQEVYDEIEPNPSVCQGSGGSGVRIYLADTGLLADAASGHPWLAGVHPEDPAKDTDPWNGQDPIPPYTGHGTFVAGVARCMAPAADVIVTNAFKIAGSRLESDLVPRLEAALGLGVDIFHLTIAAPSRKDLPLATFEAWLKLLRQYKGVVCVVAAGNSGTRRPMWPTAFAEVVSVGALAADWRSRASFSNFGGWVDVYAPGRDLVNAYATGTYTCHVAPYKGRKREFYGMAKWSGTSFSTPVVTGLIAARMSRTGENGQEAAAALLAEARSRAIPGVGAILLPCCNSNDVPSNPEACHPHRRRPGAC